MDINSLLILTSITLLNWPIVSMSMHAEQDIVVANLSVCVFVTRWYCIKTNAPHSGWA